MSGNSGSGGRAFNRTGYEREPAAFREALKGPAVSAPDTSSRRRQLRRGSHHQRLTNPPWSPALHLGATVLPRKDSSPVDPLDRPDLLTPKEAANVLGIGTSALAALARQGQITRHRTAGGHGRYTRQDVERFRDERSPRPSSDETRQLVNDLVRLYDQGWTIRRVAAEFGFSYGKTRRLLIRHTTLRSRRPTHASSPSSVS